MALPRPQTQAAGAAGGAAEEGMRRSELGGGGGLAGLKQALAALATRLTHLPLTPGRARRAAAPPRAP